MITEKVEDLIGIAIMPKTFQKFSEAIINIKENNSTEEDNNKIKIKKNYSTTEEVRYCNLLLKYKVKIEYNLFNISLKLILKNFIGQFLNFLDKDNNKD